MSILQGDQKRLNDQNKWIISEYHLLLDFTISSNVYNSYFYFILFYLSQNQYWVFNNGI